MTLPLPLQRHANLPHMPLRLLICGHKRLVDEVTSFEEYFFS